MTKIVFLLALIFAFSTATADQKAVADTIDRFHHAASKADGERYFNLLADNAIFLGTDATERWNKTEFQAFAEPYFSQRQGWTYHSTSRHIYLTDDGSTAWFDEMLSNTNYGQCRGSGVLINTPKGWKITQYHLVIPVPNELAKELVEQVKALKVIPPITKKNPAP